MRLAKLAYALLVLAIPPAVCQAQTPPRETRSLSLRWARYYSLVYQVPVELVLAVIDEESGWDPYAVSEKGAAGLMQLMPETAARFGVRDRFRLDENIRGGVAYLASLSREFSGDLRLITAAYYVGETPIRQRKLEYSSADVQAYVMRVARRYRIRQKWTQNSETARGHGGMQ
jgi:soluble lytic murein transglycosylase-like protein